MSFQRICYELNILGGYIIYSIYVRHQSKFWNTAIAV